MQILHETKAGVLKLWCLYDWWYLGRGLAE